MESNDEVNKNRPPPDKNDPPIGKFYDNRLHNDGDSDSVSDDNQTASSAASSPSHKSHKSNSDEAATKPPPNQEMERSASGYRIPASVFDRNKSSTPADWSSASNESLFSIHMGNMSFATTDWRSEDLDLPTPSPPPRTSTSEQMFSYTAHPSAGGATEMRSHELGLAEATMLEVIKENEGQSPGLSPAAIRNARGSEGGDNSNMSFAFSVKGGDAERLPSSVKPSLSTAAKPVSQSEPEATPAEKEKKAPPAQSKWFFCFPSCCSFCS